MFAPLNVNSAIEINSIHLDAVTVAVTNANTQCEGVFTGSLLVVVSLRTRPTIFLLCSARISVRSCSRCLTLDLTLSNCRPESCIKACTCLSICMIFSAFRCRSCSSFCIFRISSRNSSRSRDGSMAGSGSGGGSTGTSGRGGGGGGGIGDGVLL